MTRILKTSGFVGLVAMMLVGIYQHFLAEGGGVPAWMVSGHAHLGVLSILAIALGIVVDLYGPTDRLRLAVEGLFVQGQWLLPVSLWIGIGFGVTILLPLVTIWGLGLILAMVLMAYHVGVRDPAPTL